MRKNTSYPIYEGKSHTSTSAPGDSISGIPGAPLVEKGRQWGTVCDCVPGPATYQALSPPAASGMQSFCWRKRYKDDLFCIYDALDPVSLSEKERTCDSGIYGGDLKLVPSTDDVFLGMHVKPNFGAKQITCQPISKGAVTRMSFGLQKKSVLQGMVNRLEQCVGGDQVRGRAVEELKNAAADLGFHVNSEKLSQTPKTLPHTSVIEF